MTHVEQTKVVWEDKNVLECGLLRLVRPRST